MNAGTRTNDKSDPRYRKIEHTEDFEYLLEFWAERGFKYDYTVGCFTIFDGYKGVTDWMTWETALNRAIELEDEDGSQD